VTFKSDAVLKGRDSFGLEVRGGDARFTVGAHRFGASEVAAAWWRKPQWTRLDLQDRARRLSLDLELERLHLAVASVVPASAWLNEPDRLVSAGLRLRQLLVAHKCGFETPDTVVTNDWSTVPADPADVIFKTFRGSLVTRDDADCLHDEA
jgi:hypothetical protein